MSSGHGSLFEQHLAAAVERLSVLAGDDEDDAELTVAILGSLMAGYLGRVCAEPDHPVFLPGPGYHLRMGTPNPDTVYLTAALDGGGTYRVSGDRGTAPEVTLMPMGGPGPGGITTYPPLDLDDLALVDGRFDVVLAQKRPAGHVGDWWEIAPDVRTVMLRSVSEDWGAHRDPVVAIVRLDGPIRRRRPSPDALAARLAAVVPVAEGSLAYGMRKVRDLRAAGVVNAVKPVDYAANGGMPGQWYHEGVFDIADRDTVVVSADLRGGVDSFSLSLTDTLGCTLDWTNAQTSLNRRQASIDDDGFLRVVISDEDPGVDNWLDTTGHRSGVLQMRWMGCNDPPAITLRTVPLRGLGSHLPAGTPTITPEVRRRRLMARAAAAQMRSYW